MNPDLTFQIHKTVPEAEHILLFEWDFDIFEGSLYNLQWRPMETHVIGYLDGKPVTHVGLLAHRVKVGGEEKRVGGIGAVVTVPKKQHQGLSKQCLTRAQEYIRKELGAEHGFLFCPERLESFYADLGWKTIAAPVTIDQPQGKTPAPLGAMTLDFSTPWPAGPVELNSFPW